MAQDSARPDFWDTRYRGAVTPWDAGGVPPALAGWAAREGERGRVLIPGCGSGYEARHLHERGYQVLAIDFSPAAVEAARAGLGDLAGLVHEADFFSFGEPSGAAPRFDGIYERAFLCALPRRLWADWAARCAALLRPGGLLFGYFYFDDNAKGPPFGIAPDALDALLGTDFVRIEDAAVAERDSLPVFRGKERWQVWQRKG